MPIWRMPRPEELRNALATVARSHGISDLARRSGVSRPGIYKALGEDGNPSFETIRSILSAMGLRLTVEPACGGSSRATGRSMRPQVFTGEVITTSVVFPRALVRPAISLPRSIVWSGQPSYSSRTVR